MPAVPAIIMGGSAIGSALLGKKASNDAAEAASKRSPEELALMKSQTGLADQQTRQGSQLFGAAMPGISSTLRYYQSLLSGGRGARVAATSSEAGDVASAYEGANASLARSNVRGGELVQQQAENARAKAGQISRLVTGVRPQAASALGGMSGGLVGAAQGSQGQAGGIYGSLTGNATQNRQQGNLIGMQTGANLTGTLGKLFANIMNQGKSGSGSWWNKDSGSSQGSGTDWNPEMG